MISCFKREKNLNSAKSENDTFVPAEERLRRLKQLTNRHVSSDKGFHFYKSTGQSTGIVVTSIADFFDSLYKVDAESVRFHLQRRDFQKWMKDVFGADNLAEALDSYLPISMSNERLRSKISYLLIGQIDYLTKVITRKGQGY